MGGEFGQWTEWNHDTELDWALFGHHYHDGLRRYVHDLNDLYRSHGALHELDFEGDGFAWISCDDWQNSVYAFIRYARDRNDFVVVLMNCTPVIREGYRIGVPSAGYYSEVLNSDAAGYGGSNVGNMGGLYTAIRRACRSASRRWECSCLSRCNSRAVNSPDSGFCTWWNTPRETTHCFTPLEIFRAGDSETRIEFRCAIRGFLRHLSRSREGRTVLKNRQDGFAIRQPMRPVKVIVEGRLG